MGSNGTRHLAMSRREGQRKAQRGKPAGRLEVMTHRSRPARTFQPTHPRFRPQRAPRALCDPAPLPFWTSHSGANPAAVRPTANHVTTLSRGHSGTRAPASSRGRRDACESATLPASFVHVDNSVRLRAADCRRGNRAIEAGLEVTVWELRPSGSYVSLICVWKNRLRMHKSFLSPIYDWTITRGRLYRFQMHHGVTPLKGTVAGKHF